MQPGEPTLDESESSFVPLIIFYDKCCNDDSDRVGKTWPLLVLVVANNLTMNLSNATNGGENLLAKP